MNSTFQTWLKVCQHHNIPRDEWTLNGQYNYIEFKNGSRIDLLDIRFLPSDPLYERFGSLEFTDGAIEEASECDSRAYDILKTRIGRHLNKEHDIPATLLLTANPRKNWLYTTFYQPWVKGTLPKNMTFIQSLYGDNPYTSEAYERQLEDITDLATKERLKYGNWDYADNPNGLIDYTTIQNMFTNDFVKPGAKKVVADIARYGSDRAIITVWSGLQLTEYQAFNISSTVEIENAITALKKKYYIPVSEIVVDDNGVGGGVTDHLKCKGFDNAKKALNPAYYNQKCECGFKLAELAPQIWINCKMPQNEVEAIMLELSMLRTYDADSDGKLKIMPKDKIKELIGRSPDWLDCFIMRMYWEIRPERKGMSIYELSELLP